jgi:FkbM family methyltransferase
VAVMVDGEVNLTSGESAIPGKATASVDLTKLAASPRVKPDGGIMAPMVSYAQNFEDVMLRRALQDIESGFYVDIGAADPDLDSVTRWFYSNGWRGINVEPDPRYFARLEELRSEDVNLQCAVGGASGNIIFNVTHAGGLSTGSGRRLAEIVNIEHSITRPIVVPVITLDQLFTQTCGKEVDFLKIDAEGMEDDILNGASFVHYRPKIVVVESTLANSQKPAHQRWEPMLLHKGYRFAWFDGLNRFYVRSEDEWRLSFFKVPPCYFDNFWSVTINAKVKEAAERAALTEGELSRALVASRTETDEARREAAEIAERYEAMLSEAFANAVAAGARAEASEAEAQRAAAEFEVRKAALESDLEKSRVDATEALQRQQTAEAEAVGALRRQQTAEAEAVGALRRRQTAEAEAAEALRRQQTAEAKGAEQIAVLEVALVRAKREAAEALRREQGAEAEAVEALRRHQIAEVEAAEALRQQAAGAASVKKGGRISSLNFVVRRRLARLLGTARRAARQGNWPDAELAYGAMVSLCCRIPRVWLQYGHALKEQGKFAAAERAYRKAIALDPSDPDAHLQLGHALKLRGAGASATEAYIEAFRLQPSFDEARSELIALQFTPRQFAEIVLTADLKPSPPRRRHLRKSVSGPRSRLLLGIARTAARQGDWPAAAARYRRLLARFPGATAVWVQLGHALKEQAQLEEAEGAYLEALKRDRNSADTFLQLGHLYKLRGEREDSLKAYLCAFRLQPNLLAVQQELQARGIDQQQMPEVLKEIVM